MLIIDLCHQTSCLLERLEAASMRPDRGRTSARLARGADWLPAARCRSIDRPTLSRLGSLYINSNVHALRTPSLIQAWVIYFAYRLYYNYILLLRHGRSDRFPKVTSSSSATFPVIPVHQIKTRNQAWVHVGIDNVFVWVMRVSTGCESTAGLVQVCLHPVVWGP